MPQRWSSPTLNRAATRPSARPTSRAASPRDLGAPLDPLDHVVDGQRGHRGGGQRLHLDAGRPGRARLGGERDRRPRRRRPRPRRRRTTAPADGRAESARRSAWRPGCRRSARTPSTSPFGASPPATAAPVSGDSRTARPGDRTALGRRLVADVDHPRAAAGVEVRQLGRLTRGRGSRMRGRRSGRAQRRSSPSRSSSIGSGSPLTIDSKNSLRS